MAAEAGQGSKGVANLPDTSQAERGWIYSEIADTGMEIRHNLLSEYAAKFKAIYVAIFNFFYIKCESSSLVNIGWLDPTTLF